MRWLRDRDLLHVHASWLMLGGALLASCTAGTEPSTNPRDLRSGPGETMLVSGRVVTPGPVGPRSDHRAEAGDSGAGGWITIGSMSGQAIKPSRPIAGVVVELGIVHFAHSSDTAASGVRSVVMPFVVADVWSAAGERFLEPGPAEPPGRFEMIARTTTNGGGEFQFAQAPRRQMLMVRARPPAPYQETYSDTPFWSSDQTSKEVNIVLRGGR